MTDFTDMKTASQWSPRINAGCDDRLRGKPMAECAGEEWLSDARMAYEYGWTTTDEAENKAGRSMLEKTNRDWENGL